MKARWVAILAMGTAVAIVCSGCLHAGSAMAAPSAAAVVSLLDENAEEAPRAEPLPLTENPFSFRFRAADVVFELPVAVAALMEAGFAPRANLDEHFVPGACAWMVFDTGAGLLVAQVANIGAVGLTLPECQVVGVRAGSLFGEKEAAAVELPGGLGLGAVREEVLAACGVPDAPKTAETDAELCYSMGRDARLRFAFGNGGEVAGFEMYNLYPRAAPPAADDLPAEVLAYTPPGELGDDPWSYRVLYGGALYALPAPVAAFLENGWVLRDEGTVAPGQWVSGVSLCLGNQVLRTTLRNFSGEDQPLAGCFVVMAEGSDTAARVPIELPSGLTGDADREAVLAALGAPASTYRGDVAWEYCFAGADGQIVARFWRTEDGGVGELYELEVWHHSLT